MKKICLITSLLFAVQSVFAQTSPRTIIDFNKNWKFFRGNDAKAINPAFDDRGWRQLDLPHDWSIEANFSKDYPATNQGGALPGGIAMYRKTFVLTGQRRSKKIFIEFDGVYENCEVWINGHYVGKRPNGYISFYYDLSPYIKPAPAENVLVVKADNSNQPNSRWYTGSGIYRDVRLVITHETRIDSHDAFITTPVITKQDATIAVNLKIKTEISSVKNIKSITRIYDAAGKKRVQELSAIKIINGEADLFQQLKITHPVLWSPANPYLYKLVTELIDGSNTVIDRYTTRVGIRSFYFDSERGFFLNKESLKIKGVCMHHDLGALGSAFNMSAAMRQLKLLKEMGCNAIRTAHNPPAPGLLDLCDEMGFLVMDEAFDMWNKRKNRYDYHLYFNEWHRQDLADMIKRDRNHPSVFLWSIGNEIREQFDSSGIAIGRELASIVKALDSTRPVICALTENVPAKNFIYQSGALDVLGFNYKLSDYSELPARFPGQKLFATETASALSTRGVYDQPSDSMRVWPPDSKQPFTGGNKDMTVSAYDHVYAYWGATHEKSWLAVKKYDFMAGCFVWSGFDFLGEPVPYPWSARSSYYGIIDLAGFPKDIYYMYQSEWTDKPVLHLFPHWNWKPGQWIDVWAYYNNADEVELFLNGKSLGIKRKINDELHIMWRVQFAPGTLKAVSRKNGRIVLTKQIQTAAEPARIELSADRQPIRAGGNDLAFVTARIVDRYGNTVPDAGNLLSFSVSGAGKLEGTDNGYPADTVSLKNSECPCWKGMALAIIRSAEKQGNITLIVTSKGLPPAYLSLKTSY